MTTKPHIPGAFTPKLISKSHHLQRIIVQAAASEAAVDLLRELALGNQAERPLTFPVVPRWAAMAMEGAHG